jgi:hypothetical protein
MSEINHDEVAKALTQDGAFVASLTKAFSSVMADAMAQAMKATVADPPPYNQIHGHGSLFGAVQVGIDPEVVSAMMHWRGVGEHIPIRAVRTLEDFLPFITGVEETSSTERSTECGNCISGETEACIQHFPTGLVCRETKAIKLSRAIERLNRGDIDLDLLNNQLGSDSPWHPGFAPTSASDIMQIYTAWALLFELPPLFMQKLSPMVYTGNPTNNVGNAYREFRGLQLLVNTGHVDAFANVTCPALDSDVKDFNFGDVKTQQNPSFYETLEMAHFYVADNARGQRLDPAQWAIVMRGGLWQILSSIIPVQSIAATLMNAAVPASFRINLNGTEIVNERNNLRQSGVIALNGQQVPVIVDDGIPELNNANNANLDPGEYASDVYVLPIRYLGNREGMRIEYKDYRFITPEIAATDSMIGGFYKASPDGRFSWSLVRDGPCFKIQAETEPRIILRTPQLAARIQNVKYVPLQHLREPDFDSPYFFKGGVSTRGPTAYYH